MEAKVTINETPVGYENNEGAAPSGLGRGLNTLLYCLDKQTSFGLGKGLGALIGGCNKYSSSSDKK